MRTRHVWKVSFQVPPLRGLSLLWFQYHTTKVGNKRSSVFHRDRTRFLAIRTALTATRFPSFSRRRAYTSVCSRSVPVPVEEFETVAAELRRRPALFRRCSRTAGRALSSRLLQTAGPRPKGTHDSRLSFRGAP